VLSPLVGAARAAELAECSLAALDTPGDGLLAEIESACRSG